MNSGEWSKKFDVLSISRRYLHQTLGFSTEAVERLTDADMQRIADMVGAIYFEDTPDDVVKFTTRLVLTEKETRHD